MREPRPLPTGPDRYRALRGCLLKAWYRTYDEAKQKKQYVYACEMCNGFHRTSKPLDAASQIRLIERIYSHPVTPELVTQFQALEQKK